MSPPSSAIARLRRRACRCACGVLFLCSLLCSVVLAAERAPDDPADAAAAQASQPASTTSTSPTPTTDAARKANACVALLPRPWPTTLVERRLHLRRMEAARPQCMTDSPFLAALGALWLDDGDPDQARTWLERALMLDPDNPAAQADHALALAALGEPTALRELADAWRMREDVPAPLRERLLATLDPQRALRLPAARLGSPSAPPRRLWRGDASLTVGYESNLAFSPRLTELTLTPPEGEVTQPVISTPRRGAAVRADLAWQAAWELGPRQILRTGLGASARSAAGNAQTDWQQATAALGYQRRFGDWSATAQVDAVWFGGRLTEPYALWRWRLLADLALEHCNHGLQLELDARRQSRTRDADSRIAQVSWSLQCRPAAAPDWQWSVQLRTAVDQPRRAARPGGSQRIAAATLRLTYRPDALTALDLATGYTRIADREGYSPLLEHGAVRWQGQAFVMLEASRALSPSLLPGLEWVAQATRFGQASNLTLFRHNGFTLYSGLRWPW